MHYARLGVGFWFRPWRAGAHVPERRGAAATRRFWRELLVSPYPRLRIMTSALRYLRRPQAECEARKIAPRRASIYT